MKANERVQWVEYLLKREFAGRGWSAWLLTHPAPSVFASPDVQESRAQAGIDAEIAIRRIELEALPDDGLERAYLRARVRELEANADSGSAKAKKLERENESLRQELASRSDDTPLSTKVKTTLLCIIGGLAEINKLDLSHPYAAGAVVEKALSGIKVTVSAHSIGNHLKEVSDAMANRGV